MEPNIRIEPAGPPVGRTVLATVLAQAAAYPERAAVVSGDAVLTFGELATLAGRLARRLSTAGVRPGSAVASCLPRGAAVVTSVLGIWLAGGTYVPLDPEGPPRRLTFMLRDCRAHAVVAAAGPVPAGLADAMAEHAVPTVTVDALGAPCGNAEESSGPLPGGPAEDDLAYVIYTSGTTGKPKGVMVEHGSLAAMAAAHEQRLHCGSGVMARRVAQNAASTFDVFFADLVNLASGRTLYVADEATRRDPERLAHFLTDNGIQVLNGTPTQIRAMLAAGQAAALSSLQILILSGEAIDAEMWRQLRDLPGVRVYNFYGPTECTVHVTAAAVADHEAPVIGEALPGCRAWVVDAALRPVPGETAGEICISGSQVARGYLNSGPGAPDRFVEIYPPRSAVPIRAYRTGDRGRRDDAGQIEFLGRLDDQVSIAGHRIELREVEAALRACPGVSDAAVGLRGSGPGTALAAWVVLAAGYSVDDVREWAASLLPQYMMPRLKAVPMIPMSRSGKADVAALLEPAAGPDPESATGEPVGDSLRSIWCAVLGVSSVGEFDDFFALGGDSLKATNVTMAARAALMPELPIRVIFDHPRFDAFSGAVNGMLAAGR